jgi:hypothetical protein
MVEVACENNEERLDSDSDLYNRKYCWQSKGMVVAVLADGPLYEYYAPSFKNWQQVQ